MTSFPWQLKTPIDAILFDCDGTLSQIEGVNELAKENGVAEAVEALTHEAMGGTGLTKQLYQMRLNLIRPTKHQVDALGKHYFAHSIPDAHAMIQLLHRLKKSVYVISAGVNPAVTIFAEQLGIPRDHIHAVDMTFDHQGNYIDFDHTSPLVLNHGKRHIVTMLKNKYTHLLHIGDGLNDYATHDIVTRYIGYGGVYYREKIESLCQYYIYTLSLSSLLPLCLTLEESLLLQDDELVLYNQGLNAIKENKVKV